MLLTATLSIFLAILVYKTQTAPCEHKSFTSSVIPASCSEEGKNLHTCEACGYYYVTDIVPKKEHSFTEYTVEPSCASEGYTFYFCSCGELVKGEALKKLPHTLKVVSVPSTCSALGYTEYSCESCNYSYRENASSLAEHSFTVSTKQFPTALEEGYTEHFCECSHSYKDDFISYSEILKSPYLESSDVLAKGIDVSRWNHQIDPASGEYLPLDWSLIKSSGFDFVILKAGSTRSGKEPTFELDYAGARAAGLEIGVYFYTYSQSEEETERDVAHLLEYLEGKVLEYPVYFDLEDPSLINLRTEKLTELCEVFICSMQKNGYYSALYTNNNWLRNILDADRILSLFDIWYARYPETELPVWNEEKYGKQLSMWQYTQSGEIAGLEGYFDFNYCYRNYAEIMRKWGLNGFKSS